MKRDIDLVRHILAKTEEAEGQLDFEDLVTERWPYQMVAYHVEIMYASGLVDAMVKKDMGGGIVLGFVNGLTWDGQDYLDAIRNDAVWARTKRVVRDSLGSTTMGLIKEVAIDVARKALGLG